LLSYLLQVVLSGSGTAAQLISKYRPPCPIVVVSDNEQVLRGLAGYYAIVPCKVGQLLCMLIKACGPQLGQQQHMSCAD
jgi:pyruvate kinase